MHNMRDTVAKKTFTPTRTSQAEVIGEKRNLRTLVYEDLKCVDFLFGLTQRRGPCFLLLSPRWRGWGCSSVYVWSARNAIFVAKRQDFSKCVLRNFKLHRMNCELERGGGSFTHLQGKALMPTPLVGCNSIALAYSSGR
jgi:hypothetical protein